VNVLAGSQACLGHTDDLLSAMQAFDGGICFLPPFDLFLERVHQFQCSGRVLNQIAGQSRQ